MSDLDVALAAGRRAQTALQQVVQFLEQADRMVRRDVWIDWLPFDVGKLWALHRARRCAALARPELEAFQTALAALGREHTAQIQVSFGAGAVLGDLVGDVLGDLRMLDQVARNRRQANIAVSRVRRVVRALEGVAGDGGGAAAGEDL